MDKPVQKILSKFSVASFLVALFFVMVLILPSRVLAATDNQTGGINFPQVAAENLTVNQSFNAGALAPLTFTINNTENRGTFDIGYRVFVLDDKEVVYYQKDFSRLFVLEAFEKKTVDTSIDLPKKLPSGEYRIRVNATGPNGEDLGGNEKAVKITGADSGFVPISDSSISTGGKAINPGDTIVVNVTVDSKSNLNAKQKYAIFPDNNFDSSKVSDGGLVKLSPGANKVSLSVKSLNKPGNFTLLYWLEDEGGNQISPIQKFGWDVWGVTTDIKYLTIDKQVAKAGENVDVEVALDSMFTEEKVGMVLVKVWVDDSYGEKGIDFSQTTSGLVGVKLKKDINKPVIRIEAQKDGKVILDYKTNNRENVVDQVKKLADSKKGNNIIVYAVALFLVLLVIGIFLKLRKSKGVEVAVFFLLAFSFLFLLKNDVFASSTNTSGWGGVAPVSCGPPSSHYFISSFLVYKNGSGTASAQNELFRPGDTIHLVGSTNSPSGSCTFSGSGSAKIYFAGVQIGSGGRSWDVTYVIPDTFDINANKSTTASAQVSSGVLNNGTPGSVNMSYSMTFTMGPKAVDTTSMSVSLPACASANYNATFNFTGRALADNYDIQWSTDSTFATGVVTQTILGGAGAITYTTTTAPFALSSTYYWRVNAYNSIAGSSVVVAATNPFGPVSACPLPDLVIRNSTDGTVPPVDVSAPAAISGSTITVQAGTSFTLSFNTRNIGTSIAGNVSCTVMEAFSSSLVGPANACTGVTTGGKQWFPVVNLASNTSTASSATFSYPTIGTYSILIRADAGAAISESNEANNDVNLTVNVTSPPSAPGPIAPTESCLSGFPEVHFSFTDTSTNEDQFSLQVSPNGGASWAAKVITTPNKAGSGETVSYVWSRNIVTGVSGPMSGGLVPTNNTPYLWRVMAMSTTDGNSAFVPSPPQAFTTLNCAAADLNVHFVDATWKDGAGNSVYPGMIFQPSDKPSVDVVVTNNPLSPSTSPVTDLYIYYKTSAGMPDCGSGVAATAVPTDAASVSQGYSIPALAPGASATIHVQFTIGAGGGTAYAYAVPRCEFDSSPWADNVDFQTYIVQSRGFFLTTGGDVGATGSISESIDSRSLSYYQSDYILAAGGNLNTVYSQALWEIRNYGANKLITGGKVYEYFKQKFLATAQKNTITSFPTTAGIYYYNGNLAVAAAQAVPDGNTVVFINGELDVNGNFGSVTGNIVFIASGDIRYTKAATRLRNVVSIGQGSFYDLALLEDPSISNSGYLGVNGGAVYVDGSVNFNRTFSIGANNSLVPSDYIVYNPGFLAQLVDLLGVKAINWQELAP